MGKYPRSSPVGEYYPLHITANGTAQAVGRQINTTTTTVLSANTQNQVVTPASMTNVAGGIALAIFGGTGTAEQVVISSAGSTTFTANFTNAHSGTNSLISLTPVHFGRIVVGNAGTSAVLTLYNGHPNLQGVSGLASNAGLAFSVITLSTTEVYEYNCFLEYGLWYTLGSSAAPDLTLTYLETRV